MSAKEKIEKDFAQKKRTRKEVDADYQNEAVWLGHKIRLIATFNESISKLEKEVEGHTTRLLELNAEGVSLPPEEVKAPETIETTSTVETKNE